MLSLLLTSAVIIAPNPAPPAVQSPGVEGWVLMQSGKPLKATVGLIPMAQRATAIPPKTTESLGVKHKKKPGFRLEIPKPGFYLLDIAAKDHEVLQVPMVLGDQSRTDLTFTLKPEKPKGEVKPCTSDPKLIRWIESYQGIKTRERKYAEGMLAVPRAIPDFSADATALAQAMQTETDPDTQAFLAIAYLNLHNQLARLDPASVLLALDKLPAASPLWSLSPRLPFSACSLARKSPQDIQTFRDAMIKTHPDPEVRATALFNAMNAAFYANDETKIQEVYTTLSTDYKETDAARAATMLEPHRKLLKGKPCPSFQLTDITQAPVTLDQFKDKVLLLFFWKTKDPRCTRRIEELQRLYKRYRGTGLEILSIVLDDKPKDYSEFCARQIRPIPWLQVVLEKEAQRTIQDSFLVKALPKLMLVGPDAKIIEAFNQSALSQEGRLIHTLTSVLTELGKLPAPAPAATPQVVPVPTPMPSAPAPADAPVPPQQPEEPAPVTPQPATEPAVAPVPKP